MYSKNRLIAGTQLIELETVDSTNAELARRVAREQVPEGTVIHTQRQSHGRGQAGNLWQSEANNNLTFSLIIYPGNILIREQFFLSMAVSVAIYRVVRRYVSNCFVKWPNDIYIGHNKLGGILIENALQGEKIKHSIIGIGLNINQKTFSRELPNPTSLALATGKDTNTADLLQEVLNELDACLLQLRAHNFKALKDEYLAALYRWKQPYLFEINGEREEGIIQGVSDTGELQVLINGEVRQFQFKQIKYLYEWWT
ncbi:MAG: biotin--[acetyl-CoA-carboxylase] ligase [Bacteroidia bacterium]